MRGLWLRNKTKIEFSVQMAQELGALREDRHLPPRNILILPGIGEIQISAQSAAIIRSAWVAESPPVQQRIIDIVPEEVEKENEQEAEIPDGIGPFTLAEICDLVKIDPKAVAANCACGLIDRWIDSTGINYYLSEDYAETLGIEVNNV